MDKYFNILGLKSDASQKEIRDAYLDLVKVWHPDRFTNDPRLQKKAQEKLKEINNAYNRLKDNQEHVRYSARSQSANAPPRPQPTSGPSSSQSSESRASQDSQQRSRPSSSQENEARYRQADQSNERFSPFKQASRTRQNPIIGWAIAGLAIIIISWISAKVWDTKQTVPDITSPQSLNIQPIIMDSLRQNQITPVVRNTYIVEEGDTLTLIADAFKSSVDAIKASNGLSSDVIFIGQRLVIDGNEAKNIKGPLRPKLIVSGPPLSQITNTATTGLDTSQRIAAINTEKEAAPVDLNNKKPVRALDYFTIGSTKDDVLAVQGTPSDISGQTWWYGLSSVKFSNDKVIGYTNNGGLKIKVY